jgi:Patatin-like phospholipase
MKTMFYYMVMCLIKKICFVTAIAIFSLYSNSVTAYNKEPVRILSLDGGALLGFFTLMLLERVEKETNRPISALVDSIVGSSTGAIIGASLCVPHKPEKRPKFSAENITKAYQENASKVFSIRAVVNFILTGIGRREWANYEIAATPFEKVFQDNYGDAYLSQSLCHLMISTYRDGDGVLFFDSKKAQSPEHDVPLWQAVRASASLQDMFDFGQAQFNSTNKWNKLIDSGLKGYVDPAQKALPLLRKHYPWPQKIVIYSIGTGLLQYGSGSFQSGEYPAIEIVRIEPDFSDRDGTLVRCILDWWAGSQRVGAIWDGNYLGFMPFAWYTDYIKKKADAAYDTPEYRRMLKDLSEAIEL